MLSTKKIGTKITKARKKVNISQAQLAERLFISPQAVGKWERGESMPDVTTFNRLAEILGVDFNYFSESFQSISIETHTDETLEQNAEELRSVEQKKKPSWNLSHGNWVDADFSGLNNLHEKFSSSNMQKCKFIGSNLSGLLLKNNNVVSCDFSNSNISNSHIKGSNFAGNFFKDCSLKETEFSGSNIDKCDFSGSNLAETQFSKSYISDCNFNRADFTGVVIKSGGLVKNTTANAVWNRTTFIGTHLEEIIFDGTIDDCYFENCGFKKVTFQHATLTNTFFKNNKNLKRIEFIDCKADRMTYEFLKQGKADLSGITLLSS